MATATTIILMATDWTANQSDRRPASFFKLSQGLGGRRFGGFHGVFLGGEIGHGFLLGAAAADATARIRVTERLRKEASLVRVILQKGFRGCEFENVSLAGACAAS